MVGRLKLCDLPALSCNLPGCSVSYTCCRKQSNLLTPAQTNQWVTYRTFHVRAASTANLQLDFGKFHICACSAPLWGRGLGLLAINGRSVWCPGLRTVAVIRHRWPLGSFGSETGRKATHVDTSTSSNADMEFRRGGRSACNPFWQIDVPDNA